MATFYRVMTQSEWADVEARQKITPSKHDWGPHGADTVVFLFDETVRLSDIASRAAELAEQDNEPAVVVTFELTDLTHLKPDESGWSDRGARVHVGPIEGGATRQGIRPLFLGAAAALAPGQKQVR